MSQLNDREKQLLTAHCNRNKAMRKNAKTYVGTPCLNGHSEGVRYTATKACVKCVADYGKAWKKTNKLKEKKRKRGLNRNAYARQRAKYFGVPYDATAKQCRELLDWQGGCCAYCGSTDKLELDHRLPLSRGGAHTANNLQWLCGPCNRDKSDIPDELYRLSRGIPSCTKWDAL